jgi:hypothetical protein
MTVLRRLWHNWKRFGMWMGDQVARVFLVTFYFTIALPFGLLVRATQDPLDVKPGGLAGWTARPQTRQTLADAERQF